MHRFRSRPPDRLELDPPASADHSTWILGRRPRSTERLALASAGKAHPVGARDCFWVTRLL